MTTISIHGATAINTKRKKKLKSIIALNKQHSQVNESLCAQNIKHKHELQHLKRDFHWSEQYNFINQGYDIRTKQNEIQIWQRRIDIIKKSEKHASILKQHTPFLCIQSCPHSSTTLCKLSYTFLHVSFKNRLKGKGIPYIQHDDKPDTCVAGCTKPDQFHTWPASKPQNN